MSNRSDHDFSEDRDSDDWNELGIELAAQQGREHDAERAYREAIATGHEMAMFNLGLLLARQPGRQSEAELAYQGACAAGILSAWTNLGALLGEQPGREAEAEQAYREGAAAGSSSSMYNLGALLARMPGREHEAEQAYRDAIEAGDSDAWDALGLLLAGQPQRQEEAEAALRAALAAGCPEAQWHLGGVLSKQPDRRHEALTILREELAEGQAGAGLPLGTLLEARWGRDPEQEAAYRQAMSYDDDYVASMAAAKLGVLLDTRGDLTSALACYEFALERGFDEPAACLSCHIGWLRAYPGDADGARSAFEVGLRSIREHVAKRLEVDTKGLPGARFATVALAFAHGRYTRRPVRALRLAMFRLRRAIRKA